MIEVCAVVQQCLVVRSLSQTVGDVMTVREERL